MIPISLRLENFLSHNNSIIDFSKFKSALIIGNIEGDYSVSNGSGKSAILEGILWCLFNKSRVSPMDDIIMWGQKVCRVEMIFEHQNEKYKIVRVRNRQTSNSNVNLFRHIVDENWENISGSTSSLTNKKIIEVIKADYKTFINSVYFRQNDISEFAEVEAGRRKEILKSIIDISRWDRYESDAKTLLKYIKSELTKCEALTEGYTEIKAKLLTTSDELMSLEGKHKANEKEYEKLNSELEVLSDRYEQIKQSLDTNTWDKIVLDNKELSKVKIEIERRLKAIERDLAKAAEAIKSTRKSIQDKEKYQADHPFVDISTDLDDANKTLLELRSKKAALDIYLKEANEKVYPEGVCPQCEQEVSDELHEHLLDKRNEKIANLEKEKIFISNKINEVMLRTKQLKKQADQNKAFQRNKAAIKAEKEVLKNREASFEDLEERKKTGLTRLRDVENNIKTNNDILDSLKNDSFQDIGRKVDAMKKDKERFIDLLNDQNKEIGILTERKNNLSKKIDSMKKYLIKMKELKHEKNLMERLARFYGKNGIQTILLNAIIEDLEKTSNIILDSICSDPFTILLETQRLGSDGIRVVDTLDLKVRKDGATQNFNSLSGGEMFRVCLAIRIALSEISSRHGGSSLDFLMLDEVNSPLDRSGTESLFVNVIKRLEDKYKILVITHNDSLKEKFNDIIDVTKINGESSVRLLKL